MKDFSLFSPKKISVLGENEDNFAISTVILMAAFGTKNVHSAVGDMKKNLVQFDFQHIAWVPENQFLGTWPLTNT